MDARDISAFTRVFRRAMRGHDGGKGEQTESLLEHPTSQLFLDSQPMLCSTGKVSINQLLSWVKTPARKPIPVSTSNPPITRST